MRKWIIAAALCAAGSAWADQAEYVFDVTGSAHVQYTSWHCPNFFCNPSSADLDWTGTFTVVLDSSADGVYTDADVVSIILNTNVISHSGISPGFSGESFTVLGGQIVSFSRSGPLDNDGGYLFMNGTDISYSNSCNHCDTYRASGTLTPVPEPMTYSLMLAGLGAVGWATRRRRPCLMPLSR